MKIILANCFGTFGTEFPFYNWRYTTIADAPCVRTTTGNVAVVLDIELNVTKPFYVLLGVNFYMILFYRTKTRSVLLLLVFKKTVFSFETLLLNDMLTV